jgi:hypothetical protein
MLETNQGMTQGSSVLLTESTMDSLSLFNGDILEITGGRTTVAFCHPESWSFSAPTPSAKGQKDWIMMNAETRSDAGIRIGDAVTVRKTRARIAGKIHLLPMYRNQAAYNITPEHLKTRSSNAIAVMVGDNIVAGFHSSRQILQVVAIAELAESKGTLIGNMEEYRHWLSQKKNPAGSKTKATEQQPQASPYPQTPFVIYPQVTEFEILENLPAASSGSEQQNELYKSVGGFPAFWVDVSIGARMDPGSNQYLVLQLSVSHYDGFVNASFEVQSQPKTSKQQQGEPFDFGRFLQGLKYAADEKPGLDQQGSNPSAIAMRRMMDPLGGIHLYSASYIEAAAKIMEEANEEWRISPGSISPSDVKYRILKKWAEI